MVASSWCIQHKRGIAGGTPPAGAWGVPHKFSFSLAKCTTNNHKGFFIVKGAIFSENVTTIFIM
ncbi:hypothetical protein Krac_0571 [Ktedonobacter racemifer DSM 44963]|uniref:Uncharacterized protein n=1 Tax=Ktedonobacter racemifer DSM 44963 TaxID=485913 RepID=D6U822_KTERA|nr:hypothetical protein Krac_0571 [Ktedonobacter racemifer DSM 44963]